MAERRVVVTGMGVLSPFGAGVDCYWSALLEGRSGVGPVTLFDTSEFAVRFAGEVPDFDPALYMDRKIVKRLDRYAQFAIAACGEAVRSSGLDIDHTDPYRVSVVFGSGIGGLDELEQQHTRLMERGPSKVSVFTIPKLMVNAASGNISIQFGANGNSVAISSACASATHAMGEALCHIRTGRADAVITGGSEAAVTPLALSAFAAMKALSTRNDDPARASRPFDRGRDGFVMAEGAGAFIFEELEFAKRRGANILAEVIGFGASSDAQHITQPAEDGQGASRAMQQALADARIAPDAVDYINAHGTSTPLGDVAETIAIKRIFGAHAHKLVVSSTKSSIGHSLGASGGMEVVACTLAIRNGVVPPTINLDEPSEDCDLDYCPHTPRDRRIRIAMSNSFGFGGHNACILVKAFTE